MPQATRGTCSFSAHQDGDRVWIEVESYDALGGDTLTLELAASASVEDAKELAGRMDGYIVAVQFLRSVVEDQPRGPSKPS